MGAGVRRLRAIIALGSPLRQAGERRPTRTLRPPNDVVVAEITVQPGEVIGVSSLARQQESSHRIRCRDDVRLVCVPHEVMDDYLRTSAVLAHEFAKIDEVRNEALDRERVAFDQARLADDDQLLPVNMRRPQDEGEEAGDGS